MIEWIRRQRVTRQCQCGLTSHSHDTIMHVFMYHGGPTHASRAWIGGNVRASRGFNLEQCYAGIICVGIHCTSSNLEVCRADGVLIDEVEPFVAGRTRSIMWQGRLDRACWGRREPDVTCGRGWSCRAPYPLLLSVGWFDRPPHVKRFCTYYPRRTQCACLIVRIQK
jgi:hypothetical protein